MSKVKVLLLQLKRKTGVFSILLALLILLPVSLSAQNSVGIGTTTPDSNAVLHLVSKTGDQGLLVPRTDIGTFSLGSAQNGMLVFDTVSNGFFYWDKNISAWQSIGGSDADWTISGGQMYNATQDVGIQVSNPVSPLQIGPDFHFDTIPFGGGVTLAYISRNLIYDQSANNFIHTTAGSGALMALSDGEFIIELHDATAAGGTTVNAITSFRLDTSGNAEFDFMTGNSASIHLNHLNGGVELKLPEYGFMPYQLVFPDSLPSNPGDVLASDASGNLYWSAGGSDADWTVVGNQMYNTGFQNVGVNTNNPVSPIQLGPNLHIDTVVLGGLTIGYMSRNLLFDQGSSQFEHTVDGSGAIMYLSDNNAGIEIHDFASAGALTSPGTSFRVEDSTITIEAYGGKTPRLEFTNSIMKVGLKSPQFGTSYDLTFPDTLPAINGQVLSSDINGNMYWSSVSGGGGDIITDADGDTYVRVEDAPDNDVIRFSTGSDGDIPTVFFQMDSGRFHSLNTNRSVYIGEGVASNTLLGAAYNNVFIGAEAGMSVTNSGENVFIGDQSGYTMSSNRYYNTFVGARSGAYTDSLGNGNVLVGYGTGEEMSGEWNSIIGWYAGENNSGIYNNIMGYQTGRSQSGDYNNIFGYSAGFNNSGNYNNIFGWNAGLNNTGSYDFIVGDNAGNNNSGNNVVIIGVNAGQSNTQDNFIAIGPYAGSESTGWGNTFIGYNSGTATTTGGSNTMLGYASGRNNTTGWGNTFMGVQTGQNNQTGYRNVYVGYNTGGQNDGRDNTAMGYEAGFFDTTAIGNTNIGFYAGREVNSGNYNTYLGWYAGKAAVGGGYNVGIGQYAGQLATGTNNIAIGREAGETEDANENINIGSYSGRYADNNDGSVHVGYYTGRYDEGSRSVMIGYQSGYDRTAYGSYNTFVGNNTDANANSYLNSTCLGNGAIATGSNMVRIGNTVVSSIGGYATWTNLSDGNFKKNVKEDVPGLDLILKLRPVTYNLDIESLDRRLSSTNEAEFKNSEEYKQIVSEREKEVKTGFIAQEVEAAAKEIGYEFSGVDTPDSDNDFYGLRYSEFVVPLVKSVQEQQEQISALKKENEQLKKDLEAIKAKLGID